MNSLKLFKVLSDKSRLQILNSLLEEPMVVERIASRLGLATSTVSFHLKKLEDAGLITSEKTQYYKQFSIKKKMLDYTLSELIKMEKDQLIEDRDEAYRKKVLDTFFVGDSHKSLPVQMKKKRIVLEELAKSFKADRTYEEHEVNAIIEPHYDDYCTVRRYLIDFGLLKRERNTYKKC